MREISRSNTRDPEVDMIFEVVICDDGDHAIMMSFTEHEDWFPDMRFLPGATVSSHWSGTDSSDGFSAEDWAHRRRTYQRILSRDPHGRPAGCRASLV
ncbi:hypothetical protein [Roseivivax sp. THAF30]|uniref:hypothetical protein n=1 Tax=Roseivivax sp. THAF30 TaxID=2587852 RepID=UPI0012679103|nr:hypothetical protein [Roseivivax sp. THAF30]QFT61821.1 hypothetical protein FIU91_02675 [Roseivivax sp. THAF30]